MSTSVRPSCCSPQSDRPTAESVVAKTFYLMILHLCVCVTLLAAQATAMHGPPTPAHPVRAALHDAAVEPPKTAQLVGMAGALWTFYGAASLAMGWFWMPTALLAPLPATTTSIVVAKTFFLWHWPAL